MIPDRLFETLSGTNDTQTLFATFAAAFAQFGAEHVGLVVLMTNLHRVPVSQWDIYSTWPEGWRDHYIARGFDDHNPIIARAISRPGPIRWFDRGAYGNASPAALAFLDDLTRWGFVDGISIPVYGPHNTIAMISGASRQQKLAIEPEHYGRLTQFAQFVHTRAWILSVPADPVSAPLTEREREVLLWLARGKSNAVIGEILGISANTVETLVGRCFRKLDVNDRVSAALKAVGMGLIRP